MSRPPLPSESPPSAPPEQPQRAARIEDVARIAGVSTATVSRALSDPERVSPKARARVMEAVAQVGYLPNQAARSLRSQKSRMVLVVLPDLSNVFFSRILQGIEDVLFEAGYGMIIGNLDGSPEKEARFAAFMATGLVDGAILLNGHLVGQTRDGQGSPAPLSVPLVALCEAIPHAGIPQIEIDNRGAARAATLYLARQGHGRIAYVTGPAGNSLERERFAGYRDGLEQSGLPFDAELVVPGDYTLASGAAAAEALLRLKRRPGAVFCSSDEMAIGLVGGLAAEGIEVPDGMSVVGFDDIEFAAMARPSLTTIHQPRRELGRTGARVLLDLLAGRRAPAHVRLETKLVERLSTRPAGGRSVTGSG
ncbi:LacI family DNA-binding transcriptional regulator [Salinarimonas soli]|uniref:LacI family transcriptional regulator n=1 Tax=Salinarimonas soli TaxID=1638099 RepID=A0A5B2VUB9_9HYPH|nr:LacI family DNA-binding transcriptional regulator [Salinarimonas soli]KAA2242260.1 LacI family transcriptional regulator [Salinarimonas soli]